MRDPQQVLDRQELFYDEWFDVDEGKDNGAVAAVVSPHAHMFLPNQNDQL